MGGFRKPSFDEETRSMDTNSPEYKEIKRRHDAIEKAEEDKRAYTERLAKRIIELITPARSLNVSKLSKAKPEHLIEVGKAARKLREAMKKAGMISESFTSGKWTDF